jgi:very-short-patch-repair endonuclease
MISRQKRPVLIAIMNNKRDLRIAREEHWYRIPVKSAPKRLKEATHLAFYQTKTFGEDKWAVRYYAEIRSKRIVRRKELLPDEPYHPRADEEYYKIALGHLQMRSEPILSKKGRRITFISTTWEKFQRAKEINDLFDESPLEDEMWEAFKKEKIEAERQVYIPTADRNYFLDFALFCQKGRIDVECNGDTWHRSKDQIPRDNARDNTLTSGGWSVLRFSTPAIREDMPDCLSKVKHTINKLGGLITSDWEPRYFRGDKPQLELFEEKF